MHKNIPVEYFNRLIFKCGTFTIKLKIQQYISIFIFMPTLNVLRNISIFFFSGYVLLSQCCEFNKYNLSNFKEATPFMVKRTTLII